MRNADCHDGWNGPEMRDEADACLMSVDECYLAHGKSPSNTLYRVLCTSSNNAGMFIQLVDSQRVVSAPYGTGYIQNPGQCTGTKTTKLPAIPATWWI